MQQSGLGPLLWWEQEDDPIDGGEYVEEQNGEAQVDGGADAMEGLE